MLKFGRKKRGSPGKPELPPEQEDDDASPEDRITAMTPGYAMPSALSSQKFQMAETNAPRRSSTKKKKAMPPLFLYMESGDFQKAKERARRHPREVKTWATIKIKSSDDTTKRLALHQACFKLRAASTSTVKCIDSKTTEEDPFIELCRFILVLIEMNPDACRERETRHGCLPLHLAAFASCTRSNKSSDCSDDPALLSPANSTFSTSSLSQTLPSPGSGSESSKPTLARPSALSHNQRSLSEATADTYRTTMTAAIAEERFHSNERSPIKQAPRGAVDQPAQSVSMGNNIFVSEKREEWIVKVLNALLDAYPRAIKSGSEGGRMPLHFATAGRATPRVVSTLLTAYPDAAKHRTKDGSLPIHLCAHWGISHSKVVVIMLKSYPDSTYGRNRWERTPLEEALCMAGENGRPHQAALVRALRKHHSFWTRPEGVLFQRSSPARRTTHHIVDIDETVDSMEDSMNGDDDDHLFVDTRGVMGENQNQPTEKLTATGSDLPTLIRASSWNLVIERLKIVPSEARIQMKVPTRGGFTSTEGFTPLHYACERRPPKEVVGFLISLCPEAVVRKTMPGGKLPLHIACTWHAPKETIDLLLAADRRTSRVPDDLGNLPIHSCCFAGASSPVIEKVLKAYPKAVLSRTNQGSLPEDISKRLKHDNRVSALALLNLCREEVNTKRNMKHRRNLSEGYNSTGSKDTMILNGRVGGFDPSNYEIDNFDDAEIEITYSTEKETKKELVWI